MTVVLSLSISLCFCLLAVVRTCSILGYKIPVPIVVAGGEFGLTSSNLEPEGRQREHYQDMAGGYPTVAGDWRPPIPSILSK